MNIRVDIQSASEEARAARRQVLSLIAAYRGGETTYMSLLEDLVNAVLGGTTDPVVLARRIAYFIDSATLISFAAASALAEYEHQDIAEVLKILEQAIDKRIEQSAP